MSALRCSISTRPSPHSVLQSHVSCGCPGGRGRLPRAIVEAFVPTCAYRLRRRSCCLTGIVFAAGLVALDSHGAWPQARTIKVIQPSPPGGTADAVLRLLAGQIGRSHGVTMVIENRPGAGTAIGTEIAARAAPDGNTLLLTSPALVLNQYVRKLSYSLTSFEPICNLTQSPQLIAVSGTSPYRTMTDLVGAARAKPGELTLASTGPATQAHVGFEQFRRAAKIEMTYVPFPGNASTVNALLGAHVTAGIANYADLAGHFQAGTLRALATTTPRRVVPMPDLPTVAESGFPEFEYELWFGMFAPAKTPPNIRSRLANWFSDALGAPEVRDKLMAQGLYPIGTCGADFEAVLRQQDERYRRALSDASIKVE
jgi:tripartite-type tricarboxylate transporter receptor subunit TctC